MEKVLRCIHAGQFRDIKNGNYPFDVVGVYYGFPNYNRTAKQILELIDIIRKEVPNVGLSNLNVYEITKAQSDRHAHHTMVEVYVDTKTVKNNFQNYTIL